MRIRADRRTIGGAIAIIAGMAALYAYAPADLTEYQAAVVEIVIMLGIFIAAVGLAVWALVKRIRRHD